MFSRGAEKTPTAWNELIMFKSKVPNQKAKFISYRI